MRSEKAAAGPSSAAPPPGSCFGEAAGQPPRGSTRSEYDGSDSQRVPIFVPSQDPGHEWPTPQRSAGAEGVGHAEGVSPGGAAIDLQRANPSAADQVQMEAEAADDASTDLAPTSRASGSQAEVLAPAEVLEQARRELQEATAALEVEESDEDLIDSAAQAERPPGTPASDKTEVFGVTQPLPPGAQEVPQAGPQRFVLTPEAADRHDAQPRSVEQQYADINTLDGQYAPAPAFPGVADTPRDGASKGQRIDSGESGIARFRGRVARKRDEQARGTSAEGSSPSGASPAAQAAHPEGPAEEQLHDAVPEGDPSA